MTVAFGVMKDQECSFPTDPRNLFRIWLEREGGSPGVIARKAKLLSSIQIGDPNMRFGVS